MNLSDPGLMGGPNLWITLLKGLGILSLVLGLLMGTLYLIRQLLFRTGGISGKGVIKMLAVYHVSSKERIILMDVLGEKILLGVTPHHIQSLARLSVDSEPEILRDRDSTSSFAASIKDALVKRFETGR
ncbi:MAG: flagellar biosynthetic protein FliO [Deltaproteobacteria bacterium]|nr:flagellar biosynthetic protein FliO [Deltaproteobacteria bacterium]MBW1960813.1 flagellar biosynthetic protein FliO [Deltaproteobacteria bacterium]MBW1994653.1 flagellar biosynthetic protein FliO [Deltaproteobacteria bacterium]MBW2151770.1 flagellar biosynthetic protein FliO [Deltaproteobacteria bacterium]